MDDTDVMCREMANAIRALAMDAVEAAKSGHPGMPMGMADVATVLFRDHLKFDASVPDWPDRDRFVLSAGHGSMLLYALLYLNGYPEMDLDDIKQFRQLGAKTAGHPEYGHAPGIETTTGPLGQGIANAVGMALGERLLQARLGSQLVDHHTYVLAGDGCLMEGVSQEAISLAGHLGLGKLIVLFDDNAISIDGSTDLATSDDVAARFKASAWHTAKVDGHNPSEISNAIAAAKADPSKPWMIACKTVIGFGSPNVSGTAKAHGAPLGADEIALTREQLDWPHAPFDVPEPILSKWRANGQRGKAIRDKWEAGFASSQEKDKVLLETPTAASRQPDIDAAIAEAKASFAGDEKKRATRIWSQLALEHLVPKVPELIGGSADLTGSNGTLTKHHKPISATDFGANYIHYGVREHGMAAAMNGLALHGGIVPYGATFLVFTDYCRPSIRLSALMKQRVIYVMTHDSIGLGEDGPTHQPVEHLAALRAMPNVNVLRPADAMETAECWQIALEDLDAPTVLALTRQGVEKLRPDAAPENHSRKGGYVLHEPDGKRDVTLIATGSEVGLAKQAADALASDGIKAAVVSLPGFRQFANQDAAYRDATLGSAPRIGIEAGVEQGWRQWLRDDDIFIGLSDFGASAPAGDLYRHFGITSDAVISAAKKLMR